MSKKGFHKYIPLNFTYNNNKIGNKVKQILSNEWVKKREMYA